MDVSRFLDHVRREPWYDRQIVHVETVPPREARALTTEAPLHPDLQGPVETEGMWPLYSHQARAIDALRSGKNVIVSTPAASGKSLCYNLTVLDCLLEDRTGSGPFAACPKGSAFKRASSMATRPSTTGRSSRGPPRSS